MHFCANVVGGEDGHAGAVLLRAGEVVSGLEVVKDRRSGRGRPEFASGPAILTSVLGLDREDNGADLVDPASSVRLLVGEDIPSSRIRSGPRVGVATAMDTPWRFWIDGSPAVSAYRRGGRRKVSRPAK
jgi:DNA-3-methyladenine glycosylase